LNEISLREAFEIVRNFKSQIKDIELASTSIDNFGVKLMCELFSLEELTDPQVNVLGQAQSGSNERKIALDAERVNYIKDLIVERFYENLAPEEQITKWLKVKDAMNKKLSALRLSNLRNI
jgi:hypothetical protein